MKRFFLTTAVLAFASVAHAGGPIRQAIAEWREARQERREARQHCGGCQSATSAAASAGPVVHQTVYSATPGMTVVSNDSTPVIRLGSPVPTCSGGVCR